MNPIVQSKKQNNENDYIRAPELSSPMSTINRDSKCTFIPDKYKTEEKIGRCNKSISTFHGVTIKPHPKLNGIHDADYVLSDYLRDLKLDQVAMCKSF